jgi:hypothetical protein
VYSLALPFALVLGYHRFMNVLIKLFDHLGKLLTLIGFHVIHEQYVIDYQLDAAKAGRVQACTPLRSAKMEKESQ